MIIVKGYLYKSRVFLYGPSFQLLDHSTLTRLVKIEASAEYLWRSILLLDKLILNVIFANRKAERELTENEIEAIKFVKNSEKSFLSISSSVDQTNENGSKKRKKSKKNKPKSAIDVFMKSSKQKENSPNGQPGKEVESFVGIVDTPDAQQCNQVDEDVGQVVSRSLLIYQVLLMKGKFSLFIIIFI